LIPNLLLRAVQREASAHSLAVEAMATLLTNGHELFITPQILIEFWAVATRPIDANGLGWSSALVQTEIERLRRLFSWLDDNDQVFSNWLQIVSGYNVQGKQVHDARLVAVMQTYQVTHLLTFNVDDFRRYQDINIWHPDQIVA
jgi:predicted nucleic acid-binding protein